MGWLIAAGSVLAYAVGALITFRVIYLREVEHFYQSRNRCNKCTDFLERYRNTYLDDNIIMCMNHWEHSKNLRIFPTVVTVIWPIAGVCVGLYYAARGIAWAVKKITFPSGVKTTEKTIWDNRFKEATIDRRQTELNREREAMGLQALEAAAEDGETWDGSLLRGRY